MAVQVIYKTCNCPNCRESLRFTRRDCSVIQTKKVRDTLKRRFRNDDEYLEHVYYEDLVEEWHLICPTCRKRIIGFSQVLQSTKLD